MALEPVRQIARNDQDLPLNPAPLAPLVEALAARVASLEGELASTRAAVRAHMLECDAQLDVARQRLGQARNVEQRCRKILEQMRLLKGV